MSAPPIEEPSREHRADSAGARSSPSDGNDDDRVARLRDRISELESELDRTQAALERKDAALSRKDAELDAVRCRYEAILEEWSAEPDQESGLLSDFR